MTLPAATLVIELYTTVVVDENGVIPPEGVRGRIGRVVSLTGRLFIVGDALVLQLDPRPGGSS